MSTSLILNPHSGGGDRQAAIRAAAHRRGVAVHELGSGDDPTQIAAAADADVLAVAGGDGTISSVAAVAVERDLPLLVVPCGTRNHFATDALITFDPADPLRALDDGHQARVDVGSVNGRTFVNNVSIGFYGPMVSDPQYRSSRLRISARYFREATTGRGEKLDVTTDVDARIVLPEQALTVLVSNNAYAPGVAPGHAMRPRLDGGRLWIHVLGVDRRGGPLPVRIAREMVDVMVGRSEVAAWSATGQTLRLDRPRITLGCDGEAVELEGPLEFRTRPGALRLLGTRPQPRSTTIPLTI